MMNASSSSSSRMVVFSSSSVDRGSDNGMASLYVIPPRDNARGHVSGTWRYDDCLCDTIACSIEQDEEYLCVIRLTREDTGELFAMSRIPRDVPVETVVEAACDSSRNFVIRVEDPETKRHAFLGLSFEERSVAMDFRMALAQEAGRESRKQLHDAGEPVARDLTLKQGETMHLSMSTQGKTTGGGGGFFLSRLSKSKHQEQEEQQGKQQEQQQQERVVATTTSQWETF